MITYTLKLKLKQALRSGLLAEMLREAKWMTQYIIRYWKAILYYIMLGVLGTAMGLAGSVASKYLIDAVTGFDKVNIRFIIVVILCMALGNIFVGAAASRISTRISLKVNNEMLAEIYDRIMGTDWEAISEYHSGDLLNRLNTDVETVAGSVLGFVPSLITRLLQFFGTLLIIMYYDPVMALIALISAPVSLLMSKMLMLRMRDYNRRVREISSEMMAFGEESFQNIQIIKCFELTNFFGNRLRKILNNYIKMSLDYNKFTIITSSLLSIIGLIVSYAAFGWGVYRLWSGFITYGTMTLFLQLSSGLSGSFASLASLVPSAISATTSAGRIMAVIELPREKRDADKDEGTFKAAVKNKEATIFMSHIDFIYKNEKRVFQDASLYIRPREMIAVIGSSGEGKTTLLRILLGLLKPTAGEVTCTSEDGTKVQISSLSRGLFSYVPQDNTFFSGTIEDTLRMGNPKATEEEISGALKAAYAYDFVMALPKGIHSKIGEKGGGLSEGQLQRLSIARALLRDSPFLLLDEATSALDPITEEKVLRGIITFEKATSCILTTHRQSVIAMCNRVYEIIGNKITEVTNKLPTGMAVDS